jgi:RNA polymerase sigma factor (sigma-70 family)
VDGLEGAEKMIDTILFRAARSGNKAARNKLIENNMPLVKYIYDRSFKFCRSDGDDIIQAGYVGLIKAVDAFDPDRGVQFHSYAYRVIFSEMVRFIQTNNSVSIPVYLSEVFQKVYKVITALASELGREPTISEISERSGLPENRVQAALSAFSSVKSLDDPVYESDDVVFIDRYVAIDASIDALETKIAIEQVLKRLAPNERKIIRETVINDRTLSSVGSELGVTHQWVGYLRKQALQKLQKYLCAV